MPRLPIRKLHFVEIRQMTPQYVANRVKIAAQTSGGRSFAGLRSGWMWVALCVCLLCFCLFLQVHSIAVEVRDRNPDGRSYFHSQGSNLSVPVCLLS